MTIFEEALLAARGIGAIIIGRRDAFRFFDFSPAGLAGSLAAFFVALLINGYMPFLIAPGADLGPAWRDIFLALLLFGLQIGFAVLVLRQFGRLDGVVPYLVADNWASFYMTLLSALLALLQVQSTTLVLPLGVLVLVIQINISRLIVTLTGWQIAAFLAAQFAAVIVGMMFFGALFPNTALVVAS